MTDRRVVRVIASFWEDLDNQLGSERGANGEPSSVDFLSVEVVEIVERFAVGFDELAPLFPGRLDYRVLVKGGMLFKAMKVVGVETQDGSVELVGVEFDLSMDWD